MQEDMPKLVSQLIMHGALLVGSRANFIMGSSDIPDDWDLIVPPENWNMVAFLIPSSAKLNDFGGWQFPLISNDYVDIWPMSICEYLKICSKKFKDESYVIDIKGNRYYSSGTIPAHTKSIEGEMSND